MSDGYCVYELETNILGPRTNRKRVRNQEAKAGEGKELARKNLVAAVVMRNQEGGRATTMQSSVVPASDGQELSDLENGQGVVGGASGTSA